MLNFRNDYYVYVLMKPNTELVQYGKFKFPHEPFYVGKGQGNRYLNSAKDLTNKYKRKIVNHLLKKNTPAISMIKIKNLSESQAFEYEMKLITKIGRIQYGNGPLTNMTSGGQGSSGAIITSWIHSLTPKERQIYSEKLSKSIKRHHAQMTENEKIDRANAISLGIKLMGRKAFNALVERRAEGIRQYYEKNKNNPGIYIPRIEGTCKFLRECSNEQRKRMHDSRSKASKAWHKSLSPHEKARLKRIWSDKRKISWNSRSASQRKIIGNKIAQTKRLKFWESIPYSKVELSKMLQDCKYDFYILASKLNVNTWTIKNWIKALILGKTKYLQIGIKVQKS